MILLSIHMASTQLQDPNLLWEFYWNVYQYDILIFFFFVIFILFSKFKIHLLLNTAININPNLS